jgi:hypothetical protein
MMAARARLYFYGLHPSAQKWLYIDVACKIKAARVSDSKIDIRSFYEIGQSLMMGRSSESWISATVRDGRFVSTKSLWKDDGPLSDAAVGSEL